MLNKELIKNKLAFIHNDLKMLNLYENCSLQDIASDFFKHTVVERIIERIINDALDINQHIISEMREEEPPQDYKKTFLALVALSIFPEDFAEKISDSVGLRNALVHNYRNLDEKRFYDSIKDCLNDYSKYCEFILQYIKKQNGKNK